MRTIVAGLAVLLSWIGLMTNVVAQESNSNSVSVNRPDYELTICEEKPSAGGSITAMNMIDPSTSLAVELENRGHQYDDFSAAVASIRLTRLKGPTHGTLIPQPPAAGRLYYEYRSDLSYVGRDRVMFMAGFQGIHYRIVIDLIVSKVIDENAPPQCPEPRLVKIGGKPAPTK